ncbi:hypothetical protein SAMN05444679_12646 [Variovorax sp. CF079]|uniref:hypothetical protein n=1 Tax=Variovorax sp. CF079 TaxID=1882774 RepID=UPI00088E4B82|nr:hypothetical protein [Variovorax sp. CF079]SDE61825.1 hypothetical protein SAMN05444679_12646 [Variovorax sp. CF079]
MIQTRAYPQVISTVGLIAAFFFGAQWLTLPRELTKDTAQMAIVDAEYIKSRWPQARFVRVDGTFEQASCGRVRPLCAQLKNAPIKRLAVWFAPSTLGEEAWVVAVESGSQTLLSEARQQAAFADFKTKPAFMAGLFLLLSLAGLFFARLQPRGIRGRHSGPAAKEGKP